MIKSVSVRLFKWKVNVPIKRYCLRIKKKIWNINWQRLNRLGRLTYWSIIALIILLTGSVVLSIYGAPGGYRMFVVLSGSMEPQINIGSIVLVKNQANYLKDDIITFITDPNDSLQRARATTTHRITEIFDIEGGVHYKTKGDRNANTDLELITKKQILGKVVYSIPTIGKLFAFARTQLGFTVLIVIPSTILIYNELLNIKTEIQKALKKPKKRINKVEDKLEQI